MKTDIAYAKALHAHETALRSIQITDADSLCAYLKGFWEFIYNYKMINCVYDIYGDDIEVFQENGFVLRGIPAVEQDVLRMCAAFPDLQIHIATIFAAPKGEDAYQVWMRYYLTGTNTGPSIYGPPTGLKLEQEKSLNICSYQVARIDGEWLIVSEKMGRCSDHIRAVCTGDTSFSSLKL